MKKFGRICFCFVPVLLILGIQILVSIPVYGITFANLILNTPESVKYYDFILNYIKLISTDQTVLISINVTFGFLSLFVFLFWYQKCFRTFSIKKVPKYFNPVVILSILLLSLGLLYCTEYLAQLLSTLFPSWLDIYTKLQQSVGFDTFSPIFMFYAIIIAPINEELAMRGVTLEYAEKEMPFWLANFLQAALFGLIHLNPLQSTYATIAGLLFGYICHKGGSIYITMLLHILFNFFGTVGTGFLLYKADQPFFFILWLVVGILLLVGGLLLFQKGVFKRDHKVNISSQATDI